MSDASSQQPSENVTMETGPVICQRCRQPLAPLVLEQIHGLVQLRAGNVLISKIEAPCMHCGRIFYWNIREKAIEDMTMVYKDLISKINRAMY